MNSQRITEIEDYRRTPQKIRNISIIAHPDHGKTSLSDSLLSNNKIISPKLAGKLRYLDSRPDQQERCITMKSSSISLVYSEHLINVIDSPGHVDFASQVGAALRVCDGALLVVDVIQGVSTQTANVLRQSWDQGIKLCLLLNKIDRLIMQLEMNPLEAYKHIYNIIEQANALISVLYVEYTNKNGRQLPHPEQEYMFYPQKGNVAFASAIDRWAFTLREFAIQYSKKMGFNAKALCSCLWGEKYFNPKTKKVQSKPFNEKSQQMCVQFIFNPLWKLYYCVMKHKNLEKLKDMLKQIQVTVATNDLDFLENNPRATLRASLNAWIPLDTAILDMAIRCLPSPQASQASRMQIVAPLLEQKCPQLLPVFSQCNSFGPVSAFISKMVPVDPDFNIVKDHSDRSHDSLIAFCRVFSGIITPNSSIYVIQNNGEVLQTIVTHVYLLMGQYLMPTDAAPAGNIVGLGGLKQIILKSATLSTLPTCPSFSPLAVKQSPILKVAVEPQHLYDMNALIHGLQLLDRSDNSVEIYVQDNGEQIMAVCGEVHLQKCVKDLQETFAKVPVCVSEPIVSFKETAISEWVSVCDTTPNRKCIITATCFPLSPSVLNFLNKNCQRTKQIYSSTKVPNQLLREQYNRDFIQALQELSPQKKELIIDGIQAFGPRKQLNCLLVRPGHESLLVREFREAEDSDSETSQAGSTSTSKISHQDRELNSGLIAGFDLASNSGPLCGEPMYGICIVIQKVEFTNEEESREAYGPFHGQVISTMKDLCKEALMKNSPRLIQGYYFCNLQSNQENIGKLYTFISKRRGNVIQEVLQEGTDQFVVEAYLPVAESLGFANELRRMTSGLVIPFLTFQGWEVMIEDPFYVPTTQEQIEEEGDQVQLQNLPKRYINQVRKRKGLATDEKMVIHAEKQRNLTKMR